MAGLYHTDSWPDEKKLHDHINGGHYKVGQARIHVIGRAIEIGEEQGANQVRDCFRHRDQGEDLADVRWVHQFAHQRSEKEEISARFKSVLLQVQGAF